MHRLGIEVIPVTPFQQNCTLLWDTDGRAAVVIDPGGDLPKIEAAIARAGVRVEAIWLTHGHLDHAGAAMDLRDTLKVPIVGPGLQDRVLLEHLSEQGAMFGISGLRNVTPDLWLTESATVSVGAQNFAVMHCPGHTPGHVVFVNHEAKFAQVGDVLFRGSVGRTDFPYADHAALIAAIRTKLLPLGDEMAFVCGHGPNSTIGAERRSNPFLQ